MMGIDKTDEQRLDDYWQAQWLIGHYHEVAYKSAETTVTWPEDFLSKR